MSPRFSMRRRGLVTEGRQDIEIDRISAQMLMEPGITGVRWLQVKDEAS